MTVAGALPVTGAEAVPLDGPAPLAGTGIEAGSVNRVGIGPEIGVGTGPEVQFGPTTEGTRSPGTASADPLAHNSVSTNTLLGIHVRDRGIAKVQHGLRCKRNPPFPMSCPCRTDERIPWLQGPAGAIGYVGRVGSRGLVSNGFGPVPRILKTKGPFPLPLYGRKFWSDRKLGSPSELRSSSTIEYSLLKSNFQKSRLHISGCCSSGVPRYFYLFRAATAIGRG